MVITESTITCPKCGHRATEKMPTDACQFFYNCKGCGERLKPKPGDCCVFCSYGSFSVRRCRSDAAAIRHRLSCKSQNNRNGEPHRLSGWDGGKGVTPFDGGARLLGYPRCVTDTLHSPMIFWNVSKPARSPERRIRKSGAAVHPGARPSRPPLSVGHIVLMS
jgi:hypothetical protein